MLEEAARVADRWANNYPMDTFTSATEDGRHGMFGRHVAQMVAEDIRRLLAAPAPSPRSPEAARCPLHGAPDCGGASGGYECGCEYGNPMPVAERMRLAYPAPSPDDGALESLAKDAATWEEREAALYLPGSDTQHLARQTMAKAARRVTDAAALARAKRS